MTEVNTNLELLRQLLTLDSPSGDEGPVADWIAEWLTQTLPHVRQERLGDSLLAIKGDAPKVAVFAHIDTTGFTLGYDNALIAIGSPHGKADDPVRQVGRRDIVGTLKEWGEEWLLAGADDAVPGSRWVYATEMREENGEIVSPYLDNRGGVWAAMQTLLRCDSVAVAFTVGEEHSGHGAIVCGRRLYEQYGITQSLISDLTWHTAHVHVGSGVALSLRDRFMPRQRFLDRVIGVADASGLPWQREVESAGSSDGGYLLRSGVPLDWVFIGAPEHNPHTSYERVAISDLLSMAELMTALVDGLQNAT